MPEADALPAQMPENLWLLGGPRQVGRYGCFSPCAVSRFDGFSLKSGYNLASPPTVDELTHYCVDLQSQGLAVKSICGHLATIAFASKAKGWVDHSGDFRLRKMLESWARESQTTHDDRQSISLQVLSGLLQALQGICKSEYKVKLFHLDALVAFFGALRISELVARSHTEQHVTALLGQD